MSEDVVELEDVKGPEGLPDARKFFGNPMERLVARGGH
jgi:hypothetical protein